MPTSRGVAPQVLHSCCSTRGTLQESHQYRRILVRYGAWPRLNFLRLDLPLARCFNSDSDDLRLKIVSFPSFHRDVKALQRLLGWDSLAVPTTERVVLWHHLLQMHGPAS